MFYDTTVIASAHRAGKRSTHVSSLLLSTSVAAFLIACSPAIAAPGDLTQAARNTADILNTTGLARVDGAPISSDAGAISLATGASLSISATGAAASVSVSSINTPLTNPEYYKVDGYVIGFGAINQGGVPGSESEPGVYNTGSVTNAIQVDRNYDALSIDLAGGNLGLGASVSISATGAVASVSVSALDDAGGFGQYVAPNIASINQGRVIGPDDRTPGVENRADVTNNGLIIDVGNLFQGSSVSVSATGAVSSVGISSNAAVAVNQVDAVLQGSDIGAVSQRSFNTGIISNTAQDGKIPGITLGTLGLGASASVSSTGAVASVSLTGLNAGLFNQYFEMTNQASENRGVINNTGEIALSNGNGFLGKGASASISATGAVASFSVSVVSDQQRTAYFPSVAGYSLQSAQNKGAVRNNGLITDTGNLSVGASVSLSATGAVASISMASNGLAIGAGDYNADYGYIKQDTNNNASVDNYVTGTLAVGELDNGASVSISATGAVASTGVNTQGSSFVADSHFTIGDVYQDASNRGAITNNSGSGNKITTGSVYGIGASVSISATGSVASVGFGTTSSTGPKSSGLSIGDVDQSSANDGSSPISNSGEIDISDEGISGMGSSASISATGSVASLSVASIADSKTMQNPIVGGISQSSANYGSAISNYGSISFNSGNSGINIGVGASASISSTGSAVSASFRAVH